MPLHNTSQSYGSVAKGLHWLIALMILTLLAVGFYMTDLPSSPDKFKIYGLHKSFGITVLILAAFRLGWKMANVSPLLPDTLNKVEKLLAKAGHGLLYAMMIAMPLTGWALSSAAGLTVSVFGWFSLPNLVEANPELRHLFEEMHETIAVGLIAMVSLHALAALLHHYYYKDNVLKRMLPFTKGEKNATDSDHATGC